MVDTDSPSREAHLQSVIMEELGPRVRKLILYLSGTMTVPSATYTCRLVGVGKGADEDSFFGGK